MNISGSISFTGNTPNLGSSPFNGADNGLSIDGISGKVVLGGPVGNPAPINDIRDILYPSTNVYVRFLHGGTDRVTILHRGIEVDSTNVNQYMGYSARQDGVLLSTSVAVGVTGDSQIGVPVPLRNTAWTTWERGVYSNYHSDSGDTTGEYRLYMRQAIAMSVKAVNGATLPVFDLENAEIILGSASAAGSTRGRLTMIVRPGVVRQSLRIIRSTATDGPGLGVGTALSANQTLEIYSGLGVKVADFEPNGTLNLTGSVGNITSAIGSVTIGGDFAGRSFKSAALAPGTGIPGYYRFDPSGVTVGAAVLDATRYIQVQIGTTVYKLALIV